MLKRETTVQLLLCDYVRGKYPTAIFRSSYADGLKLDTFHKKLRARFNSSRGFPDWQLMQSRRGFHSLLIELKAEGISLKLKRGSKLREAGSWSTETIEHQAHMIERLNMEGHSAHFGIGIEEAKRIVDWYMGERDTIELTKQEESEIF